MRYALRYISIMIVLMVFAGLHPRMPVEADEEYKVKAVFLFNFARFVEWPGDAFSTADAPLIIGVLGEDPFGTILDETVKGEKINDHALATTRFEKVSDVQNCHILFVGKTKNENQHTIISALKGKNILTVSDANGFTKNGGMIRFVTEDSKIKLLINLEAARAEELSISSKLLRIAKIVESQN